MDKNSTLLAPAKINLALDVLHRREDGYHEMRMLNHSATLYDELKISENPTFELRGDVLGDVEENLITRAALFLDRATGCGTDFRIDLKKNIPERAGLAGGSADAAATLKLIASHKGIELSPDLKSRAAKGLGADVTYCLENKLSVVEGIGEIVTEVETPFQAELLILSPGIKISTPEAFSWIESSKSVHTDFECLLEILKRKDYTSLRHCAHNSFLAPVTERYPHLGELIEKLYDSGAFFVTMSGSGASLIAYYDEKKPRDEALEVFRDYEVFSARTI